VEELPFSWESFALDDALQIEECLAMPFHRLTLSLMPESEFRLEPLPDPGRLWTFLFPLQMEELLATYQSKSSKCGLTRFLFFFVI